MAFKIAVRFESRVIPLIKIETKYYYYRWNKQIIEFYEFQNYFTIDIVVSAQCLLGPFISSSKLWIQWNELNAIDKQNQLNGIEKSFSVSAFISLIIELILNSESIFRSSSDFNKKANRVDWFKIMQIASQKDWDASSDDEKMVLAKREIKRRWNKFKRSFSIYLNQSQAIN